MGFEKLLIEASSLGVLVSEEKIKGNIKGLYSDNVIWLNKQLKTNAERYSVLAEELGHHHTTIGDILDQSSISNKQQENKARKWAYEKVVPFEKIIAAHKENIKNKFEFAEYLEVTESFLQDALIYYEMKYGETVEYKQYTICFNPLGVIEWFKEWL